ncbi:MAG: hypothetical protein AAFO91_18245, partial [Bacteroidota bacterium]
AQQLAAQNQVQPIRNVRRSRNTRKQTRKKPYTRIRTKNRTRFQGPQHSGRKAGATQVLKPFGLWVVRFILFPIATVQFFASIFSVLALAAETAAETALFGIFAGIIPGVTLWLLFLAIVFVLGLFSMLVAISFFALSNRNPFAGNGEITVTLCLIGYLVPVINAFPWVFIYMYLVTQKHKKY